MKTSLSNLSCQAHDEAAGAQALRNWALLAYCFSCGGKSLAEMTSRCAVQRTPELGCTFEPPKAADASVLGARP